jgi:hypothetical protein
MQTSYHTFTYAEFAKIFKGHLQLRRLFVSACEAGNQEFVDAISSLNKGMHSIVTPCNEIDFDHAAAIWSAFYISMFSENETSMRHSKIIKRFKSLTTLFPASFY